MPRKITAFIISFCLLFEQAGFAQVAPQLGVPAYLQNIVPVADKFRPIHLRSLSFDQSTNNFNLLLDKGDAKSLQKPQIEDTTKKLLEYFKIGLTLPNSMFWVNLRPDAPRDIIDPYVEQTDLGRILLEADLQLKKDMARLTAPTTPEGRQYWDKLYQKAESLYGMQDMEIPTITRPWIVPGEIVIGESKDQAYIYKATLKVMLEQDYLKDTTLYSFDDERARELNEYSSQVLRELIIPKLTREVNASKRYAPLRQVYYSLVLAQWFKQRYQGKVNTCASSINTKDLTGLTSAQKWSKDKYYQAYKKSFGQGEYNQQETIYTPYGQTIRSYFSGGLRLVTSELNNSADMIQTSAPPSTEKNLIVRFDPEGRLSFSLEGDSIVPEDASEVASDINKRALIAEKIGNLYRKIHDYKKALTTADRILNDRFADIANAVGLTMGLPAPLIRQIIHDTKIETIRSLRQSNASQERIQIAVDFSKEQLQTPVAVDSHKMGLLSSLAAEWGHRPHQVLLKDIDKDIASGNKEAFDKISQLILFILLNKLSVYMIKQMSYDAFIGMTFLEHLERPEKEYLKGQSLKGAIFDQKIDPGTLIDALHKEEEDFVEFLVNKAQDIGIVDENTLDDLDYRARRDLYSSASGGTIVFDGRPSHLLGCYVIFRLLYPTSSKEEVREILQNIMVSSITEQGSITPGIERRILDAGRRLGWSLQRPENIDFTSETGFIQTVLKASDMQIRLFLDRWPARMGKVVSGLRQFLAVKRIQAVNKRDMSKISVAAEKNVSDDELLEWSEDNLATRSAQKSAERRQLREQFFKRMKEIQSKLDGVILSKDYKTVYKPIELRISLKPATNITGTLVDAELSIKRAVFGQGVLAQVRAWAWRMSDITRAIPGLRWISKRLTSFAYEEFSPELLDPKTLNDLLATIDGTVTTTEATVKVVAPVSVEQYRRLSKIERESLLAKFLEAFKPIQRADDVILNTYSRYPLTDSLKMEELLKAAQKIVTTIPREYRKVSLGRTPLWFLDTARILEGNGAEYIYAAFSGRWYEKKNDFFRPGPLGPNKQQVASYRKYLQRIGLTPKIIITQANEGKKTVLFEYTQTGESIASFLSILLDWAIESNSKDELLESLEICILQDPILPKINSLNGFTITYLTVDHELVRDLANSDAFDDSLGEHYPYWEWDKRSIVDVYPMSNVSERAALVRFRIIDFLSQRGLLPTVENSLSNAVGTRPDIIHKDGGTGQSLIAQDLQDAVENARRFADGTPRSGKILFGLVSEQIDNGNAGEEAVANVFARFLQLPVIDLSKKKRQEIYRVNEAREVLLFNVKIGAQQPNGRTVWDDEKDMEQDGRFAEIARHIKDRFNEPAWKKNMQSMVRDNTVLAIALLKDARTRTALAKGLTDKIIKDSEKEDPRHERIKGNAYAKAVITDIEHFVTEKLGLPLKPAVFFAKHYNKLFLAAEGQTTRVRMFDIDIGYEIGVKDESRSGQIKIEQRVNITEEQISLMLEHVAGLIAERAQEKNARKDGGKNTIVAMAIREWQKPYIPRQVSFTLRLPENVTHDDILKAKKDFSDQAEDFIASLPVDFSNAYRKELIEKIFSGGLKRFGISINDTDWDLENGKLLSIIFEELLANAWDAIIAQRAGTITVAFAIKDKNGTLSWEIEISDTGPGLENAVQTAEKKDASEYFGGEGMGLSQVNGLLLPIISDGIVQPARENGRTVVRFAIPLAQLAIPAADVLEERGSQYMTEARRLQADAEKSKVTNQDAMSREYYDRASRAWDNAIVAFTFALRSDKGNMSIASGLAMALIGKLSMLPEKIEPFVSIEIREEIVNEVRRRGLIRADTRIEKHAVSNDPLGSETVGFVSADIKSMDAFFIYKRFVRKLADLNAVMPRERFQALLPMVKEIISLSIDHEEGHLKYQTRNEGLAEKNIKDKYAAGRAYLDKEARLTWFMIFSGPLYGTEFMDEALMRQMVRNRLSQFDNIAPDQQGYHPLYSDEEINAIIDKVLAQDRGYQQLSGDALRDGSKNAEQKDGGLTQKEVEDLIERAEYVPSQKQDALEKLNKHAAANPELFLEQIALLEEPRTPEYIAFLLSNKPRYDNQERLQAESGLAELRSQPFAMDAYRDVMETILRNPIHDRFHKNRDRVIEEIGQMLMQAARNGDQEAKRFLFGILADEAIDAYSKNVLLGTHYDIFNELLLNNREQLQNNRVRQAVVETLDSLRFSGQKYQIGHMEINGMALDVTEISAQTLVDIIAADREAMIFKDSESFEDFLSGVRTFSKYQNYKGDDVAVVLDPKAAQRWSYSSMQEKASIEELFKGGSRHVAVHVLRSIEDVLLRAREGVLTSKKSLDPEVFNKISGAASKNAMPATPLLHFSIDKIYWGYRGAGQKYALVYPLETILEEAEVFYWTPFNRLGGDKTLEPCNNFPIKGSVPFGSGVLLVPQADQEELTGKIEQLETESPGWQRPRIFYYAGDNIDEGFADFTKKYKLAPANNHIIMSRNPVVGGVGKDINLPPEATALMGTALEMRIKDTAGNRDGGITVKESREPGKLAHLSVSLDSQEFARIYAVPYGGSTIVTIVWTSETQMTVFDEDIYGFELEDLLLRLFHIGYVFAPGPGRFRRKLDQRFIDSFLPESSGSPAALLSRGKRNLIQEGSRQYLLVHDIATGKNFTLIEKGGKAQLAVDHDAIVLNEFVQKEIVTGGEWDNDKYLVVIDALRNHRSNTARTLDQFDSHLNEQKDGGISDLLQKNEEQLKKLREERNSINGMRMPLNPERASSRITQLAILNSRIVDLETERQRMQAQYWQAAVDEYYNALRSALDLQLEPAQDQAIIAYTTFMRKMSDALGEDFTYIYPFMGPDIVPALFRKTYHININTEDFARGGKIIERALNSHDAAAAPQPNILGIETSRDVKNDADSYLRELASLPGKKVLILKDYSRNAMFGYERICDDVLAEGDAVVILKSEDEQFANTIIKHGFEERFRMRQGAYNFEKGEPQWAEEDFKVLLFPDTLRIFVKTAASNAGTQKDGGKGGIDLRALPITMKPVEAVNAAGSAPIAVDPAVIAHLEKQWREIEQSMQKGPMPYAQMKAYAVDCKAKGATQQMDALFACIAEILRMEEDRAVATPKELKEILTTIG